MRGWVAALLAVVGVVIVVGVGAIALFMSSGDDTAIVDLEVGDCFDLPNGSTDDGVLESVTTVDCSTPHLAEVVLVGGLNSEGREYPSDSELFAEVERACRAAEFANSDAFGLLPVAPTPELWASFDGRFLCVAIPFGGQPVTGSAVSG
jgi:hypothetical protein